MRYKKIYYTLNMDLFINYFRYINAFDILVASVGGIFLLIQFISIIPIRRKIKKRQLEEAETEEDKIKIIRKNEAHRLTWIKGAGVIREMIGLLPFLGILGTVLGLLNTLETFKPGSGVEIELVIKQFAPALTSTISAIIVTVINMLIFNMLLLPPILENESISNKAIFSNKKK